MLILISGFSSLGVQSPSSSLSRCSHQQDEIASGLRWVKAKKKEETLRGFCCNRTWIFGGDRWVRSVPISPTRKDKMDRQPEATRVLCLNHVMVRWQASERRLCSIWQFSWHCNSESQKSVYMWHFSSVGLFPFCKVDTQKFRLSKL